MPVWINTSKITLPIPEKYFEPWKYTNSQEKIDLGLEPLNLLPKPKNCKLWVLKSDRNLYHKDVKNPQNLSIKYITVLVLQTVYFLSVFYS